MSDPKKKAPFDLTSLLATLESHGVSEFEYEGDGHSIRLSRGRTTSTSTHEESTGARAARVREEASDGASSSQPAPPPSRRGDNVFAVKSPMIGTFYRAASPGATPFVSVGSKVEPGATLCIIEAMKLMNEIKAERGGTVSEILCENGKPVRQGQEILLFEAIS